jgi:hypothetical protein
MRLLRQFLVNSVLGQSDVQVQDVQENYRDVRMFDVGIDPREHFQWTFLEVDGDQDPFGFHGGLRLHTRTSFPRMGWKVKRAERPVKSASNLQVRAMEPHEMHPREASINQWFEAEDRLARLTVRTG